MCPHPTQLHLVRHLFDMSHFHRDDDSDSSDSDDNTFMLAILLTLSIEASGRR